MNAVPDRVAIVTGAGSGIGLATVKALLRSSAPTVVVGVDLAERPAELQDLAGIEWVQGDVTAASTWDSVLSASIRHDPNGARCLIASAGTLVAGPFLETALDDWRRLFEINVLGTVLGMQSVLPAMIERGQGAIAVVCSVDSLFVEDQVSAYCTSKAALLQAVRSAALEYARKGLRINAVCPGTVDTPLLRQQLESLDDPAGVLGALERRSPTAQIQRAEEIASVLCFLVSEQASGLSGAALVVDGGLTTTIDFDSSAP